MIVAGLPSRLALSSSPHAALVLSLLRSASIVALLALCVIPTGVAQGQDSWEYTPYRSTLWLSASAGAEPLLTAELQRGLQQRADTAFGAVWKTDVKLVPLAFEPAGLLSAMELSDARLFAIAAQTAAAEKQADKIYFVRVEGNQSWLQVRVRELDCRSLQWSEVVERTASHDAELPMTIWDAVVAAFTPLAKIEQVDDKTIVARLRAGGLIEDDDSPALVQMDSVFRPIIRRNDRNGQPTAAGLQSPQWTLLRVRSRENSKLICELSSGFRAPIPQKASARTERLALLVRPIAAATTLTLHSRGKTAKPLSGCQIFSRSSDTAEPTLLGDTDSAGSITLPAQGGQMETLIVRSGSQLLARLPIVPGQAPSLQAALTDDEGRLRAEGFVLVFQSHMMDLAARRELVASRFHSKLNDGKLTEAQALLEEFRLLEGRSDLLRTLNQRQREITSPDRQTQARIERLFADARRLLTRFLDPETGNTLGRELAAARAKVQSNKSAGN